MDFQEKIKRLYERHIKIVVEWGGVEYATTCSDLDEDLALKLLLGVKKDMSRDSFENLMDEVVPDRDWET